MLRHSAGKHNEGSRSQVVDLCELAVDLEDHVLGMMSSLEQFRTRYPTKDSGFDNSKIVERSSVLPFHRTHYAAQK